MMKTFLFAHNPNNWEWTDLSDIIQKLDEGGYYCDHWSIKSHKQVSIGDRAFLMRLGANVMNKGIFGSGYVKSEPSLLPHWREEEKMAYRVDIEFEILSEEPIIAIEELHRLPTYNWTPRASGIKIPENVASQLEGLWFEKTFKKSNGPTFRRKEKVIFNEGVLKYIQSKRYERNPHARRKCLESNGYSCKVCGFDFEKIYGKLGRNYIHVHHTTPISTIGEEYEVDPQADLIPICPNCHAMIHRNRPVLQVEELLKIMSAQ